MTQEEKIKTIVKALDSKKAEAITVINITELTILGDYFIIASGSSTTQTKALADEVDYKMSQSGIDPDHFERDNNNWIILDYGDIIVHVFYTQTRNFYNLENLWADGKEIDIQKYIK